MRYLKAQPMQEKYYEPVESQLREFIYLLVYAPIKAIISASTARKLVLNARVTAIEQALIKGLIQYKAGIFSGKFNAAVSRELRAIGAKFDKRMKVFKIEVGKVPEGIRVIAAQKIMEAAALNEKLKDTLNEILEGLSQEVEKTHIDYEKTVDRVTRDYKEIYRSIEVEHEESEGFKKQRSREYTDRARPYIKDWAEEDILQLRKDVEENAIAGYRAEHLESRIQRRYGAAKSKAKFLARQETAMFMSNYRKLRFTSAGVKRFRWLTAGDSRVRDDHHDLNGRIFDYANPPVIDKAKGTKGLPGVDYGCRCVDQPLIEPVA